MDKSDPLTWVVQAGWFGCCFVAAVSEAVERAAAAGGSWRWMNPFWVEALYLPSGQDGCIDGTLASLTIRRCIYSF